MSVTRLARMTHSLLAPALIACVALACGDGREGVNAPSATDTRTEPDPDQSYVVDKQGRAPVISIHAESICEHANPGEWLRMAAWQDGDVVWSRDLKQGGPPYLRAKIDKQVVAHAVARMAEELDAAKHEELAVIGLQTKNSHLNTWIDGRYVEVATCHEHVPVEQWPSHPKLEQVWDNLLAIATSILPADGAACGKDEVVIRLVLPIRE